MRLIDADKAYEVLTEYYHHRTQGQHDALLDAISRVPTIEINQWIPVTEGLPKDGQWALFTDGIAISTERYKQDILDHFWPEGRLFKLEEATAWMPLPEPWEESE